MRSYAICSALVLCWVLQARLSVGAEPPALPTATVTAYNYLLSEQGVEVVDKQTNQVVAREALPGAGRSLLQHGEMLYVACGDSGVALYDLRNDGRPRLLARLWEDRRVDLLSDDHGALRVTFANLQTVRRPYVDPARLLRLTEQLPPSRELRRRRVQEEINKRTGQIAVDRRRSQLLGKTDSAASPDAAAPARAQELSRLATEVEQLGEEVQLYQDLIPSYHAEQAVDFEQPQSPPPAVRGPGTPMIQSGVPLLVIGPLLVGIGIPFVVAGTQSRSCDSGCGISLLIGSPLVASGILHVIIGAALVAVGSSKNHSVLRSR